MSARSGRLSLADGVQKKDRIATLWRKVATQLFANQSGASLLEVTVSMMLISLMGTGIVGGLAVGGQAAATTNYASIGDILARSQLDYVAAQPFSPSGDYRLLDNIMSGFEISMTTDNLRPGILQEVNVQVNLPVGPPVIASSYKTNRLLESGLRPQAAGLEGVKRVPMPALLGPKAGLYQVIEVAPSEFRGDLVARWRLQVTPPKGIAGETRNLAIYIFSGTPLGLGPQGFSATPPSQIEGTVLSNGQASDFVVSAAASKVEPGLVTVYFYNADSVAATIAEATVQCVCPR